MVNEHVTRIFMPLRHDLIDLEYLLKYLGELKIRRVMVEAGSILTTAFINSGFCDELYLLCQVKF